VDKGIQRSWFSGVFDALGVEESARRSLVKVLAIAVATRLVLSVGVCLSVTLGHVEMHPLVERYHITNPLVIGLLRGDVAWYVSVLERGYWFDAKQASNVAFLPGFPVVSALVDVVIRSPVVSTIVVANVSFFAALVALWGWVREREGLQVAERATLWLVVFPFSFFFNTGYSESLFFLLCTLAIRDADRQSWTTAGLFASLATLTRPYGIFLVPALALGVASKEGFGALARRAPWVLMPLAALGLYAAYLWVALGTPFAVVRAQHIGWQVGQALNLPHWHATKHSILAVLFLVQMLLPLPLVALSVVAWRKLGVVSGIYSALATLLAIACAGDSVGRETLSIVPVFAAVGAATFSLPALTGLGFVGLALFVTFACGFAVGQFMG
jgi:hypothetical protein